MNKYIAVFIVVFIGYFVGNSIYDEMNKDKTPGKAKRLLCQKNATTFERGFSDAEIKYAQSLVNHGDINFTSSIEKSVYTSSTLFTHISLTQTDKIFKEILKSYVMYNENNESKFKLSYYIYENDKNDPGKKTKKSKMYAGYVVFEVKNMNNKTIYKVQIDFMDDKGIDIRDTLDCTIKSFMTFKK
jgi:hypothetical protein